MTFKEAVVKMIEGKKMVNDRFPSIVYWFDMREGTFLMKKEKFYGLVSSASFEDDEMKARWMEIDSIENKGG